MKIKKYFLICIFSFLLAFFSGLSSAMNVVVYNFTPADLTIMSEFSVGNLEIQGFTIPKNIENYLVGKLVFSDTMLLGYILLTAENGEVIEINLNLVMKNTPSGEISCLGNKFSVNHKVVTVTCGWTPYDPKKEAIIFVIREK